MPGAAARYGDVDVGQGGSLGGRESRDATLRARQKFLHVGIDARISGLEFIPAGEERFARR
jgi:hypothetical protein